ncbi:hypothetical protein Vadar_023142 [Vaccinium darrowii]|uniref:Uncharacterized protein n=1 Tax=Vaccinium darrowii TaxID=229202 RepID=A0ACB7XJS8_9ERIC|nr:hypothetical protein Vadar_023142 [Vaccinium darrowii]
MIRRLLQHSEFPAFRHKWVPEDIRETFFKCTRWQLEETMDPINCPYHYFCDSTNPANYPPAVNVGNLPDNGIVSSNPNRNHNRDIWGYRANLSCSTMEKILATIWSNFPPNTPLGPCQGTKDQHTAFNLMRGNLYAPTDSDLCPSF